jgi:5-methylcytosine-specific restriction endonuclease McrA
MADLTKFVAAHPLGLHKPYNAIKFSHIGPHGTPLYMVSKWPTPLAAETALRKAFDLHGGNCFFCKDFIPPEDKQRFSIDHVRPKKNGGTRFLHNLVFACTDCNRKKGHLDLATFDPEASDRYFKALDEHLTRCLKQLKD